jgi:S-adenosyl methyltransferase
VVPGLLPPVEHKNCWWLAEHAGHRGPQTMQRLLRTAVSDADAVEGCGRPEMYAGGPLSSSLRATRMAPMAADEYPSPPLDTTVSQPARVYNYWLGGKDNFAADRTYGDAVARAFPTVRTAAIENRRFLHRAVAFLTRDAGIRQFVDIGTGIPLSPNTHEIAQSIHPESRVVYVDNDKLVLAHARALMVGTPVGRTAYIDADVRNTAAILGSPELRETLDITQPVALILGALMHFIPDEDDPYGLVGRLVDALPPGSYLAVSHSTTDYWPDVFVQEIREGKHGLFYPRSRSEFARFFNGLDLVEPGILPLTKWHPTEEQAPYAREEEVCMYGAIGRKH